MDTVTQEQTRRQLEHSLWVFLDEQDRDRPDLPELAEPSTPSR